jgi:hypothetical protein
MNERAFLLCEIIEEKKGHFTIKSWLQDETEFNLIVPNHYITLIDNTNPQRAWLEVEYSGESNRVAAITLPKPILDKGHKISVRTSKVKRVEGPKNEKEK